MTSGRPKIWSSTVKLSRSAGLAAGVASLLLAVTACGAGGESAKEADDASFAPVTIKGALGTAEITERPERVVSLGWSTTDAILALGVVPVGMEAQAYGGNADGVLPWVAEKLDDMGAKTPEVLHSTTSG